MFFFTHLLMSKALYRHFAGEAKLNRLAFAYGNIKPDLPSANYIHHTLENCIFTVAERTNHLMEESCSVNDFSVTLGEICHYVCDFFCYYHLNEEIHNKNLRHLLYELGTHIVLMKMKLRRRLSLPPSGRKPGKDIRSLIMEIRKKYLMQPQSMKMDIDCAFEAAVWVCESIICCLKQPGKDKIEEMKNYQAIS